MKPIFFVLLLSVFSIAHASDEEPVTAENDLGNIMVAYCHKPGDQKPTIIEAQSFRFSEGKLVATVDLGGNYFENKPLDVSIKDCFVGVKRSLLPKLLNKQ